MPDAPTSPLLRYLRQLLGGPAGRELTDGELLQRFVTRRDEAAFALLLGRHGPMVLGVCRGLLRHAHDAEDAFQATFLALVRHAGSLRRGESLAGWLYQVACHAAQKARAQSARRAAVERQAAGPPVVDPAEAAARRELCPLLAEEVARLPAKYRTPVVLCYAEGKTHEEAARLLGWPTGTVAGRLSRARALLRRRLAGRGLDPSAEPLAAGAGSPAAVPDPLARATLRAALGLAAGEALAGVASAQVMTLVEGVVQTMSVTRLKGGVLVALAVALAGTGGGLLAHRALSGPPADPPKARPAAARVAAPPPVARPWRELAVGKHGVTDVGRVFFAPDGKTVVTAGTKPGRKEGEVDNLALVWEAATGKHLTTLEGTYDIVFSPDGKLLAVSDLEQASVKLLEAGTWKERAAWKDLVMMGSVEFSPDGKALVVHGCAFSTPGVLSEVRWWDVATRKERGRLKGDGKVGYLAAVFSRDSRALAVLDTEGRVRLLDAATGKERAALRGPPGFSGGLLFSPDGKTLASWGMGYEGKPEEKEVTLWDVPGGKRRALLKGHAALVEGAAFSPDGKTLATAGRDRAVKLWDVARGKERASLPFAGAGGPWARALEFSPDGKVLAATGAGADDGRWLTKLWDTATGKERAALPGVCVAAFAPRGKAVALAYHVDPPPPPPGAKPAKTPDRVKVWDLARLLKGEAEK